VAPLQDSGGSAAVSPTPLKGAFKSYELRGGKGCCVVLPLRRAFATAGQ